MEKIVSIERKIGFPKAAYDPFCDFPSCQPQLRTDVLIRARAVQVSSPVNKAYVQRAMARAA